MSRFPAPMSNTLVTVQTGPQGRVVKRLEELGLRENTLIVFSADQGWEPLCVFLGLPVPASAFPEANDRAFFKKNIIGMALAASANSA